MRTQPEIIVDPLPPDHPTPEWRYVVRADLPGGLGAPLAACRSEHRAAIVADALRQMAEVDPGFAERVREASLAERREGVVGS